MFKAEIDQTGKIERLLTTITYEEWKNLPDAILPYETKEHPEWYIFYKDEVNLPYASMTKEGIDAMLAAMLAMAEQENGLPRGSLSGQKIQ